MFQRQGSIITDHNVLKLYEINNKQENYMEI